MKHLILVAITSLFCVSCSNRDDAFCACMSAGEAFNQQSKKVLNGANDPDDLAKHLALKKEKEKACKNYETMDGPTMLKKKAACKE